MEAAGEKIFENLKNGLDSHDKLWYPVVTARLVKSNQSSSDSLQRDACNSLSGDSVPPFHSPDDRESGLWFAPLSLRAARGALVRRSVQKSTKCGTHRLDHLCAPLFVLPGNTKGRRKTMSLDTIGECTIIMYVGKTRKVVFLRNDKMGGNE